MCEDTIAVGVKPPKFLMDVMTLADVVRQAWALCCRGHQTVERRGDVVTGEDQQRRPMP